MVLKNQGIIEEVLKALKHPEAEEGLYFRNFFQLHEEDDREAVTASPSEIIAALNKLVVDGQVALDENEGDVIFRLTEV